MCKTGGFDVNCYICKTKLDKYHYFYTGLCEDCGDYNYKKRNQSSDLSGKYVFVTGGRIKIGYEVVLKLLRGGAHVITTTRFPADCLSRYQKEEDYDVWKDRLSVYALDFRAVPHVEKFIEYLLSSLPRLDILINNAAQTVRRPPVFYQHLIDQEKRYKDNENRFDIDSSLTMIGSQVLCQNTIKIDCVSCLTQIPLMKGDEIVESEFFPKNQYDKDDQQEDRRPENSWSLKMDSIDLVEMYEVLYINIIAPFLFNSRLKRLMGNDGNPSYIINVTAMEGNFYDPEKNPNHVHTNMAKAALNMMTRTVAQDYAKCNIYMNSVDVGWITNEKPYPLSQNKEDRKFKMAIDEIDGAARILDPVFKGYNQQDYKYGNLYKNYNIYPW
ncbi:MAG: SDR family oxidoreductase [Bacteroidetes bacterium]|nr:SDR family oxidoreductase [Bacteroidota bacterium]